MNNTEQIIEKLNKYLFLTRYNYSMQEQLSRLEILNEYYAIADDTVTDEQFTMKIDCAEELSGDLILPLKVKGIFLKEGRPKLKYYTSEELEKAANNPLNQKFPLILDHKNTEAGKIIGAVDRIAYDSAEKGIRWWGHINDETFARNVIDGIITDVSATVYSVSEYNDKLGLLGKDLTFGELSLVLKGAAAGNYITLDN